MLSSGSEAGLPVIGQSPLSSGLPAARFECDDEAATDRAGKRRICCGSELNALITIEQLFAEQCWIM
jgi:hypothetical protein